MTVSVRGLDEFRRELNKVDRRLGKAFGQAHKKVGERVVTVAQPKVKALPTPGGSKATSGLKPSAKQNAAVIRILGSNPTAKANILGMAAYWGGQPPRVIYNKGSGPWQPWLGFGWTPEDLYGLGPAISQVMDGFGLDEYMDALLDALVAAFPD